MKQSIARTFALLSVAATGAFAAEGSLPVRAGDTVRGTLVRCGDRHVMEMELARGETLRIRVALQDAGSPPELRILTADRVDVTTRAHVRQQGDAIVAGPFRAAASGVFRVTLTSYTAHELVYEMTTSLKPLRGRDVRLAGHGRTTSVLASAGSTLALVTPPGPVPHILVGFAGEAPHALDPNDPLLSALAGRGVSAPSSGSYAFQLVDRTKVRLVVTPPAGDAGETVEFPALADDAPVTAWYPSAGWVVQLASSGTDAPPSASPPASTPGDDSGTWSTPLVQIVAAPAPTLDASALGDASKALGPTGGVGMPLAGAPTLDEVLAAAGAGGDGYRVAPVRAGFDDVSYHVQFTVDGRASVAPMSLASGRVSMAWSVTSAAPLHAGNWTLTFDPMRRVQVLDGHEIVMDAAGRTTSVAARGFALGGDSTGGPTGSLTWTYSDPRNAVQLARRETYDGTANVRVDVGPTLPAVGAAGDAGAGASMSAR